MSTAIVLEKKGRKRISALHWTNNKGGFVYTHIDKCRRHYKALLFNQLKIKTVLYTYKVNTAYNITNLILGTYLYIHDRFSREGRTAVLNSSETGLTIRQGSVIQVESSGWEMTTFTS